MVRFFFSGLGLFLLVAASLKVQALFANTVSSASAALPASVMWFSVVVEFALGVCNLVRRPDKLTWYSNLTVFCTFFVISLSTFLLGYRDCGCLGRLQITPLRIALFDLTVLSTILAMGYGPYTEKTDWRLTFLIPALSVAAVVFLAPSVANGVQNSLQRPPILVSASADVLEIDVIKGCKHDFEVTATNRSDQAYLIGGCETNSCVLTARLVDGPTQLLPGQTTTLTIRGIRPEIFIDDSNIDRAKKEIAANGPGTIVPDYLEFTLKIYPENFNGTVGFELAARASESYQRFRENVLADVSK